MTRKQAIEAAFPYVHVGHTPHYLRVSDPDVRAIAEYAFDLGRVAGMREAAHTGEDAGLALPPDTGFAEGVGRVIGAIRREANTLARKLRRSRNGRD